MFMFSKFVLQYFALHLLTCPSPHFKRTRILFFYIYIIMPKFKKPVTLPEPLLTKDLEQLFSPEEPLLLKPLPELSNQYISCNSEHHIFSDITNKYTQGVKLDSGGFKTALLVEEIQTKETFVAFDFKFPVDKDTDLKEICNFIEIFYKKVVNKKGCLKNVICPVDIGFVTKENKDQKYVRFITNYFRGVTLEAWLNENKCKENNDDDLLKLKIMIKLTDALDDLHSKWRLYKLDIKPSNIMIDPSNKDDPEVAIIDIFGSCFEDRDFCNPMVDTNYYEYDFADDLTAMSKVFKDIVGAKWSKGKFFCDKSLNNFEKAIYNLSLDMAREIVTLPIVKQRLQSICGVVPPRDVPSG